MDKISFNYYLIEKKDLEQRYCNFDSSKGLPQETVENTRTMPSSEITIEGGREEKEEEAACRYPFQFLQYDNMFATSVALWVINPSGMTKIFSTFLFGSNEWT